MCIGDLKGAAIDQPLGEKLYYAARAVSSRHCRLENRQRQRHSIGFSYRELGKHLRDCIQMLVTSCTAEGYTSEPKLMFRSTSIRTIPAKAWHIKRSQAES